jgi:hypothetical protein
MDYIATVSGFLLGMPIDIKFRIDNALFYWFKKIIISPERN